MCYRSPFVMQKGFFYMWKFVDKQIHLITLTWFLVIFTLCATPGQYIPNFAWLDLVSFDKFVHAAMFFILTALNMRLSEKYGWNPLFLALSAIAYGMLLELMQAKLFMNRSADLYDIIANSVGCVLAYSTRKKYLSAYGLKIKTN